MRGPRLLMRVALILIVILGGWGSSGGARGSVAAPLPIQPDGVFDDWAAALPLATDTAGDGATVDFGRLWVADDARFLYLRLETGTETSLDENNGLVVYLDTDANAATGLSIGGIGAELVWQLGQRTGTYHRSGNSWTVFHDDLRFRAFPTVTAEEFELCFGRDTLPNGSQPLFFGSTVRILFRDTTAGGDQLPNAGQTVSYTMDQGAPPATAPISFARAEAGDLRIATQNVLNDGLYDAADQPRFRRLYQAVAPDIFAFQEIYNHAPAEAAALLTAWFPGTTWHSADQNDCQTLSKHPIEGSWAIDGNLATLIDTTPVLGAKLLLVNAHLPCCANDADRQAEVDRILRFLRDAMQEPGGVLDVPANTALAITGDLNLVGLAQQLRSLEEGDVVNSGAYGPDFDPDWDGSGLADLISRQTEKRTTYTWRSDTSAFWPGRLDFLIYSDSVLEPGNHFLVYTREMSPASLAGYALQAGDSDASDHLLQVRDLRARTPVHAPVGSLPPASMWVSPNPLSGAGRLFLDTPVRGSVTLALFDALGRRVHLEQREVEAAVSELAIDWSPDTSLLPGIYWLQLTCSDKGRIVSAVAPFTLLGRD